MATTTLTFRVAVSADRPGVLEDRDALIAALRAQGATLVLTDDGTEIWMAYDGPAEGQAPQAAAGGLLTPARSEEPRHLHLTIGVEDGVVTDGPAAGDRSRQLDARDAITETLEALGVQVLLTDDGTDVYMNWPAAAQPPDFDRWDPPVPVTRDRLAAALTRLPNLTRQAGDLADALLAILRGDL
jgi:hypothetical protein